MRGGRNGTLHHWLHHGFVAGAGIAATSFAMNHQITNKPWSLLLTDGSDHLVQFILDGLIMRLWP